MPCPEPHVWWVRRRRVPLSFLLQIALGQYRLMSHGTVSIKGNHTWPRGWEMLLRAVGACAATEKRLALKEH